MTGYQSKKNMAQDKLSAAPQHARRQHRHRLGSDKRARAELVRALDDAGMFRLHLGEKQWITLLDGFT